MKEWSLETSIKGELELQGEWTGDTLPQCRVCDHDIQEASEVQLEFPGGHLVHFACMQDGALYLPIRLPGLPEPLPQEDECVDRQDFEEDYEDGAEEKVILAHPFWAVGHSIPEDPEEKDALIRKLRSIRDALYEDLCALHLRACKLNDKATEGPWAPEWIVPRDELGGDTLEGWTNLMKESFEKSGGQKLCAVSFPRDDPRYETTDLIFICFTGNGPKSEDNSVIIASARNLIQEMASPQWVGQVMQRQQKRLPPKPRKA